MQATINRSETKQSDETHDRLAMFLYFLMNNDVSVGSILRAVKDLQNESDAGFFVCDSEPLMRLAESISQKIVEND